MKDRAISISGRRISADDPPYIVAEISGNHGGQLERALEIITASRDAGADAIKLQTYTADTLTIDHDGPDFLISSGPWSGRRLHELYREAHTPWDWHEELFDHCRRLGITCFSTPFDETAVELLEKLGAPAYKIASFEAIDLPLIRRVASTGKPLIISTGIADLGEISEAVAVAREAGCRELALLHCVSAYPAPAEEMNLRTIPHLADAFGVVSGLSDHTLGTAVAVTAVAVGAAVIEKHVTLGRADGGPDSAFSLEPGELADLVRSCRIARAALGQVSYSREPSENGSLAFRRSLYAVADIAEGDLLRLDNVRSIRPGYGLAPKFLPDVIGRRARRSIPRGTPIHWDKVE